MIAALVLISAWQSAPQAFPDTPENHWAFDTLHRVSYLAEFPGIGTMDGRRNQVYTRDEIAQAWLDAYSAASKQHLNCFENRRFDPAGSWTSVWGEQRKLTSSFANRLQYEFESIYDGLYKIQKEFDLEIYRMTSPTNLAAIRQAKLELEIYQLEKTYPALKTLLNRPKIDLRDVAYEDEI